MTDNAIEVCCLCQRVLRDDKRGVRDRETRHAHFELNGSFYDTRLARLFKLGEVYENTVCWEHLFPDGDEPLWALRRAALPAEFRGPSNVGLDTSVVIELISDEAMMAVTRFVSPTRREQLEACCQAVSLRHHEKINR